MGDDDDEWNEEGEEEEEYDPDEVGTAFSDAASSLGIGWPRARGRSRECKPNPATTGKGEKSKDLKKGTRGHNGGVHPNDSSSVSGAQRPTDHNEGTHKKTKKAHKPDPPDDPPASSGTSSDSDNSEVNLSLIHI